VPVGGVRDAEQAASREVVEDELETLAAQDAEAERLVQEFRERVKQEDEEANSGNTDQGSKQNKGKGSGGGGGKGKKGRDRRRKEKDPLSNPPQGEGE